VNTLSGAAKTITGAITFSRLTVTGTYTNVNNNTVSVLIALAGGGSLINGTGATLNMTGTNTITNS